MPKSTYLCAQKQTERMNNDKTQRLSPQGDTRENEVGGLLAEASDFARGVLESVQALAGTTSYSDRGSENEVYASLDSKYVYKLNDFRYSDDNLTPFFERIQIHNQLFCDCSYTLIGFAENRDGKVCAVLRQPFILAQREATQQEIDEELERLGFQKEQEGYFTNAEYDIFDAVPNNVLMGNDGHLYFIDTIIFKSDTGGLETYNSLSPRANS